MANLSTRLSLALVFGVLGIAAVAADPPEAAPPKPATGEEAKAAAEKWLDDLDDMRGLVINTTLEGDGFVERQVSGTQSYGYYLSQKGWYVTLGFAGKIDADAPIAKTQAKLKYVALDRVPTPGLAVPGWDVRPRTPVSSFKDGVEIVGVKDGKLTVKVKTKFFALYGRNPNVLAPADGPSPEGSYFQIRKNFPLNLTLTAPLTVK